MNEDMLVAIVYPIVFLIWCCIMEFVSKTIQNNKGYDGGFWWGFLLGIFGIIVVACKPVNTNPETNCETLKNKRRKQKERYKERQRRIKQKQKNNLFK